MPSAASRSSGSFSASLFFEYQPKSLVLFGRRRQIGAEVLARRGGRLTRGHRNPYAQALRKRIRWGRAGDELIDRLMVSALIEARSCERFCVLAGACDDDELARLYADLWASEHGHYRIFIDLSRKLPRVRRDAVDARWDDWLDAEAAILAAQRPGPRMHGGFEERT